MVTVKRITSLTHHIEDFLLIETGLHDFVLFEMSPLFKASVIIAM